MVMGRSLVSSSAMRSKQVSRSVVALAAISLSTACAWIADIPEGEVVERPHCNGPQTTYEAEVLCDAPLVYLRLDETEGTAAASLGSAAVTAEYGAAVVLGEADAVEGKAASFSATGGSEIIIPSGFAFEGTVQFSFEVWAKPTTIDTNYRRIVSNEHIDLADQQTKEGYSLYLHPESFGFLRYTAGGGDGAESTDIIDANVYSHLVATYDGVKVVLYVDGASIAEGESKNPLSKADALTIGAHPLGYGPGHFIGNLDEIAIYDHALSENRVKAHFDLRSK
jgi:hypothetical protein